MLKRLIALFCAVIVCVNSEHSEELIYPEIVYENQQPAKFELFRDDEQIKSEGNNLKISSLQCLLTENDGRFDCHPELNASQERCVQRGCCWKPDPNNSSTIGCYFPKNYQGYSITKIEKIDSYETRILLMRNSLSGFPNDIFNLEVNIKTSLFSIRVTIKPSNQTRYEVPIDTVKFNKNKMYLDFEVKGSRLNIIRVMNKSILWSIDLQNLIFSDQFIQANTYVSNNVLFGLGEHKQPFRKEIKGMKKYLFFNSDAPPSEENPLYGSHPMYLMREKTGDFHSVFLLNSNAMAAYVNDFPSITWQVVGGILDFVINGGPDSDSAIFQHVYFVGLPPIPPYWALGFHLCRYGYNSLENTKKVFKKMRDAQIPFDVQWNDIDFMDKHNMFTYDKKNFADLKSFINELHSLGMYYVPIFDPGLGGGQSQEEYPVFYEAERQGVLLKNVSDKTLRGKVWNTEWTAWVDFTNPKGVDFWVNQFERFHNEVPFDGAWIDMNEPSNAVDGSIDGCPWGSSLENPYFVPIGLAPLAKHTACMTARHYLGNHYDLHNVYSYFETKATNLALKKLGKRPFIISRASFSGHGRYGYHWTGDITSSWEDLQASIPNVLTFNLFGIPFVGADICGFLKDTTEELCARWQTLGAFYPFSRNHNDITSKDQDPPSMGPIVVKAAKTSLQIRYSLLNVLYTELAKNHLTGSPVVRSLALEFPDDPQAQTVEYQFLWGNSLMFMPVVYQGHTSVRAYFPPGKWFDFRTLQLLVDNVNNGTFLELESEITDIRIAIRGGSILVMQKPEVTTKQTRANPFNLLVICSSENTAKGDLYWDDGLSIDPIENRNFNHIRFLMSLKRLFVKVLFKRLENQPKLETISVVGCDYSINQVYVNNVKTEFKNINNNDKDFAIYNLNLNLTSSFKINWY